ncbi:MAG: hypothetical protein ACLQU3_20240 [Limisphaerales bacterium]
MRALWLPVFCAGALASRAALQFDVFLGYDWIVPQASWFPVVFEIKNDGPPFVGTVELDGGRFNQEQTRRAVIELPTGTLKRFVIPVFATAGSFGAWDVRLLDERGKLRAEQTGLRAKRGIASKAPLVGALARTPGGMPVIRPILPQEPTLQPGSARFLPNVFPDNPVVLEGLDCLYLNSEKALDLKVNQVNAIFDWLNGGGHLIVGVEQISDISATPWLRSVLPCELNDIRPVQAHPELQEWLRSATWPAGFVEPPRNQAAASGQGRYAFRPGASPKRSGAASPTPTPTPSERPGSPAQLGVGAADPFKDLPDDPTFEAADLQVAMGELRDGQVVVAAGDKPLIVTANRGRGRVTLLLFSPEREPFRSWKNLPTFWAKLAEVPGAWYVSADYRQQGGWSSDGIFGAMIDTRQVHKLPVTWLLLLLVVYLVVIGPLDQRWLKRIGRPMLTWITFPCYVVLFSLLIYFIGYKLRAGESEWNELHLVDVLLKGEQAELRGQTYASVYSPSNQRYRLEGRQEFATLRSEFAGTWSGAERGEKAIFMQEGDGSCKAEIFVPVWTSQLFVSDWWQPAPVPLSVTVVPQGGQWQVKVENRTERNLANAHVVIEDYIMKLGEVPAREARTFTVSKDKGTPLSDFVLRHGAGFQGAVQGRQRTFGGGQSGRIDDLPNGAMVASFLSRLSAPQDSLRHFITPPGLDLSSVAEHGNAVLLAWAEDYSPVKPLRQFTPRRSQKNTLWRVAVPVK